MSNPHRLEPIPRVTSGFFPPRWVNLLLILTCVTSMRAVEKQSVVVLVGTNFWNNPLIWNPIGEPGEGHDVSIGDGIDTPGFDAANIPIFYTTLLSDSTILGQLKINALAIQDAGLLDLILISLGQICRDRRAGRAGLGGVATQAGRVIVAGRADPMDCVRKT